MKNKLFLLGALAAVAPVFTACDDDDDDADVRILTFEDADYRGGADASYWTALVDTPQYGGALLYGDYDPATSMYAGPKNDYTWQDKDNTNLKSGGLVEAWGSKVYWNGGMAISHYTIDNADQASFTEQLALTSKGHNDSRNFCVVTAAQDGQGEELPSLTFADGIARKISKLYVTNTAYTQNVLQNGDSFGTPKLADTTYYQVIAYGYDAQGVQTGKSAFYLAKDSKVVSSWTEWNLSELGTVQTIKFAVDGNQNNDNGLATPKYFAIDDIEVLF